MLHSVASWDLLAPQEGKGRREGGRVGRGGREGRVGEEKGKERRVGGGEGERRGRGSNWKLFQEYICSSEQQTVYEGNL